MTAGLWFWLIALGPMLVGGSTANRQEPDQTPVQWHTDYELARKISGAKNLPLLVYFKCPYCAFGKRFERDTLNENAVRNLLAREFVCLELDGYDDKLANTHRVHAVPTVILANPGGVILSSLRGYRQPAEFLRSLRGAVANCDGLHVR